MRILVITFYFPPDLSAGAFRMKGFLPALTHRLPPGWEVDVLTTRPHRYPSFSADVPAEERSGAVRIRRVALPPHRSGFADQSRSFAVFARAVLRETKSSRYDLVFSTSSRLMTAVLGSVVARRQGVPLYLDIRDIFVDTMGNILSPGVAWGLRPLLGLLERFAVRRADRVNLVSDGFADYFRERYPGGRYSFIPNGVDDEFLGAEWQTAPPPRTASSPVDILYAGNIGEGQGLHRVVPSLARELDGKARFRIIGDGGKRRVLQAALQEAGVDNVEVIPPMSRAALMAEYRRADVLFLHLNHHSALRKVLPSKIFEYAATGKPIWAGVAGHSADFIRAHVPNAQVFPPCDAEAALSTLSRLDLAFHPRSDFVRRFSRQSTSAALADDVVSLLNGRG
jgi:glycosyltransferase involved in cell wall biosynthesis